eukprot:10681291-Karenia_brevis.AAC.1
MQTLPAQGQPDLMAADRAAAAKSLQRLSKKDPEIQDDEEHVQAFLALRKMGVERVNALQIKKMTRKMGVKQRLKKTVFILNKMQCTDLDVKMDRK